MRHFLFGLVRRSLPFIIIAVAMVIVLYMPDIGPERYSDLETFFSTEIRRQAMPGLAVAVVKDGAISYVGALGNDGAGHKLSKDSPLYLCSSSMTVTGLALRSLVDKGTVDLDKPLRAYLPWFAFADGSGQDVLVRHLVTHTAGVSDRGFDDQHLKAQDLETAVRSFAKARPFAAPGTAFHPIDTGYQALALVMEQATGRSYADIVDARIFKPLGMQGSSAAPNEEGGIKTVQGSGCFFGLPVQRLEPPAPFGAPSGYIISTASDMGRYLSFLLDPARWKRDSMPLRSVDLLYQRPMPAIAYGYGWHLEGKGPESRAYQSGSLEGFSASLSLWPESNAGLAILVPQASLLQSLVALPALTAKARLILRGGGADRPFPLHRLYMLLGVVAFVHTAALLFQVIGAPYWAKAVRDKAEASGTRRPIVLAVIRSLLGLIARTMAFVFAPTLVGLVVARPLSWQLLFIIEPGLAAWLAGSLFFCLLRNTARLIWLHSGLRIFRFGVRA